ncbi:MAG: BspA family leucine-rich repeat surface protein [Bacilli bacterium]|nr:BspA family leucine-rich repeat surface protein [Bacilli bacterium]
MKRIFFLLIIMLFPINVLAATYTFDATAKINLKNKELKEEEFTYQLKDQDGNVVKTAKNDSEGKIVFKDVTFEADEDYVFKLFTITPEKKDNNYNYDNNIAYIRVYVENNFAKVEYYKESIEDTIEENNFLNRQKSNKRVFHATPEELIGQAYAVCDSDTNIMTFFRDDANKYTDKQIIDNKIYFTDFETASSHSFAFAVNNNYCVRNAKKIVFKDAIKPQNMAGWFRATYNLEEIDVNKLDTSEVTDMSSLFNLSGIKKLDLSTFDTSNVETMNTAFSQMDNLEELIIDNWNTEKVNDLSSMFSDTPKVKSIDMDSFLLKGTRKNISMMNLLYHSGSKFVRLPRNNEVEDFASASNLFNSMPELEVIDLGNWQRDKYGLSASFTNLPKLRKMINHGECLNLYPDNVITTGEGKTGRGYGWYNIDDNTFYDFANKDSSYFTMCFPEGTYITFSSKEPEFDNVYEPIPEEEKKDNKKALITNPKTLSNIVILTILILTTTSTIIIKRRLNNK